MADLTSSNVRLIASWNEGALHGKQRVVKRVEIYGVTVGGATNRILASAFKFRTVEEVTPGYLNQGTGGGVVATPNADGSEVYLFPTPDGATAPGDLVIPTTPNGLYLTVKGQLNRTL